MSSYSYSYVAVDEPPQDCAGNHFHASMLHDGVCDYGQRDTLYAAYVASAAARAVSAHGGGRRLQDYSYFYQSGPGGSPLGGCSGNGVCLNCAEYLFDFGDCLSPTPTVPPTPTPSYTPSYAPTVGPTAAPTTAPSAVPSNVPTYGPTSLPTYPPSAAPSGVLWPSLKENLFEIDRRTFITTEPLPYLYCLSERRSTNRSAYAHSHIL